MIDPITSIMFENIKRNIDNIKVCKLEFKEHVFAWISCYLFVSPNKKNKNTQVLIN